MGFKLLSLKKLLFLKMEYRPLSRDFFEKFPIKIKHAYNHPLLFSFLPIYLTSLHHSQQQIKYKKKIEKSSDYGV